MSTTYGSTTLKREEESLPLRFHQYVQEWKQQTRYLSNSAQMAMLKPYQRIIGMGLPAVPLLLDELQREPDHWFWALENITGLNPVEAGHTGHVQLMAQDWIRWGQEQGIIEA